jgi:iron complex outermembrane recepter protein
MKTRPVLGWGIFLTAALLSLDVSDTFAQDAVSSGTGADQVNANGTATPEAERLIVTGSNIPTAEEVGPNPVDTYRRDDITRLAVRTPTDFVETLPAAFGPSSNDNTPITGTGATHIALRGIDPRETLILQEGRRLAELGSAFPAVDFNIFPLGLIDHIDVLKDGASPVYGTDAVAGVVNVFLIHRFRDVELYASYGNTNLGFADNMGQLVTYLLAGTGDDKTDIVIYAGSFNQDAIYSRDVGVAKDRDARPFGGSDGRSGNFAGRVDDFVYQPSLNGGSKTPTPHAYPNAASDPQYVPRLSLPRERQLFNFADYTVEIAPIDRHYLYGSVVRDLYDKYLTLFGDFKYFHEFADAVQAPRPFDHEIWTDTSHPVGISPSGFSVPLQNPFNPFTVPDYVSPGGFNPQFPRTAVSAAPAGTAFTTEVRYRDLQVPFLSEGTTDNYLFTGGLRGTLGEFATAWDALKRWEWEVAVRYNEDDHIASFVGVINNIALRAALLDTNPATAFNPFGLSENSKAVLNRVFTTVHDVGSFTLLTEDLKLNGDLFELPGGPVAFAVGTEHLSSDLSDTPDRLIVSGQLSGFGSFPSTKGSVDSWSEYWELRIPLTGPSWNFPGAHSLELDYAERYENFSDFGETLRPKFSLRWQPVGGSPVPVTLRAAYIEAFHAPALVDLFGGTFQNLQFIHDPRSSATEPQVEVDISSNPNLQPETAYERTFGGVLTPESWWSALHGLTISVDYGHIDVRGFTTQLDPQFVVDHESQFPGLVPTQPERW